MPALLHDLICRSAARTPDAPALLHKSTTLTYAQLWHQVEACASGLIGLGLSVDERVAVYLPKLPETVIGLFAAAAAGGVFVPVNPILKTEQVAHILRDCNVRVLMTSPDRAALLGDILISCPDLRHVVVVGGETDRLPAAVRRLARTWTELLDGLTGVPHRRIDADMAAILYTSGSTGRPKGVVLSHRNLVAGARSVAEYLENGPQDRLLAVLPLSFDYGLSQSTTAFHVGASLVLMDYLLPRDVVRAVARYGVTGLAAVPPLWNQLAALAWPDDAMASLRYLTNSGGAMPPATTRALRAALPHTRLYLMYGLTEAFRSTYLPPQEIDTRPDSIGKAIPNAEVLVVREDGTECGPGEPGELVHRGALVSLGYWGDEAATAERFRPAPGRPSGLQVPEMAVWSGDQVRRDNDGYLYFIGRKDEMIKTSGYRVSPTEVEEVVYRYGGVAQAVAFGVPHPMLGEAIIVLAQPGQAQVTPAGLLAHCRELLPAYMVPAELRFQEALPRNANGKIDRRALADEYHDFFAAS